MRLYVVGGAVRDRLLGLPASDRDWVAVGATPEQLLSLGYKPVGKDFPVFLHPQTGEEVALARTERKSGRGYHGFVFHAAPEVTLEQDLARRDLSINAMAQTEDGSIIDPFGGRQDLAAGVLRHVSAAFEEDPVRLLRLARFAARWPAFTVAPQTLALLQRMVGNGEVDALVAERVWQELARGLMAERPSRMFEVLRQCGALPRLLPELDPDAQRLRVLDLAAAEGQSLAVRYACLGWPDEPAAAAASVRLRVSHDASELARLLLRERETLDRGADLGAEHCVSLFERCDALRRPERFADLLQARACEWRAGPGPGAGAPRYPPLAELACLLQAARGIDSAASAAQASASGARGPAIGTAVRAARVGAVQATLQRSAPAPRDAAAGGPR